MFESVASSSLMVASSSTLELLEPPLTLVPSLEPALACTTTAEWAGLTVEAPPTGLVVADPLLELLVLSLVGEGVSFSFFVAPPEWLPF